MDRELLIMLGEMRGDIKSLHEKVDATLTQAVKTNGRVTASEGEIREIREWRSNLMGKIYVIVAVGGAAWTLIAAWIYKKITG